jgi:hypothetical protein
VAARYSFTTAAALSPAVLESVVTKNSTTRISNPATHEKSKGVQASFGFFTSILYWSFSFSHRFDGSLFGERPHDDIAHDPGSR